MTRSATLVPAPALIDEIADQPVVDGRGPDEIIGYDEHGLPR